MKKASVRWFFVYIQYIFNFCTSVSHRLVRVHIVDSDCTESSREKDTPVAISESQQVSSSLLPAAPPIQIPLQLQSASCPPAKPPSGIQVASQFPTVCQNQTQSMPMDEPSTYSQVPHQSQFASQNQIAFPGLSSKSVQLTPVVSQPTVSVQPLSFPSLLPSKPPGDVQSPQRLQSVLQNQTVSKFPISNKPSLPPSLRSDKPSTSSMVLPRFSPTAGCRTPTRPLFPTSIPPTLLSSVQIRSPSPAVPQKSYPSRIVILVKKR